MSQPKRILVLGAGLYYVPVIQAIKKIGYQVFVLDRDVHAKGFQFADEFAVIDITNKEESLQWAIEKKIDAVMPVNDFGVRTAFYINQKLNLIGAHFLSGLCGCDKGLMRDIWSHIKLPQPKYLVFNSQLPLSSVTEQIDFPIVIKPTDCGGGGRGISIAKNSEELKFSVKHATPFVKNDRLIAEEFIDGIEITVDSFVYQKNVYPLVISDKEKPDSRFRVATSLNFPVKLKPHLVKKSFDIVNKAVEVLNLQNGSAHAELIVNNETEEIKLIEIGLRGGGGHIFHTVIEQVTGINAPQELAKILCGEKPDLLPKWQKACVFRFFNPAQTGIIQAIQYDRKLMEKDFLIDFNITGQIGDQFKGLIDSLHRIGYAVVTGNTREEAIANADWIEQQIIFNIA